MANFNPLLPQSPVIPLVGITANPGTQQINDLQQSIPLLGRHGEHLTSDIHAPRFVASSRGNLFWGTSGVAGAKLLAPGGTTGSFVLYNPASSGVNLEVLQFSMSGASTETDVIAGIGIEYGVQVPSGTLTGTATTAFPLGSANGAAKAKVYAACTIVAMTFLGGTGLTIGQTTNPGANMVANFNGSLVVAPGTAINFVSTITQSTDIIVCDVLWSEWLP